MNNPGKFLSTNIINLNITTIEPHFFVQIGMSKVIQVLGTKFDNRNLFEISIPSTLIKCFS